MGPHEIGPPILHQCCVWAIFHPLLVRTVPLHHSLELWKVYQRVLGFRLSYRKTVELLYIAIHNISNLYLLLYGWEAHFHGGPIILWHLCSSTWENPHARLWSNSDHKNWKEHLWQLSISETSHFKATRTPFVLLNGKTFVRRELNRKSISRQNCRKLHCKLNLQSMHFTMLKNTQTFFLHVFATNLKWHSIMLAKHPAWCVHGL